MDISMLKVHCINCDNETSVKRDDFDKGQFVKCAKCGEIFNLYGVYWTFYEDIPLCKKIVDIITEAIGNKYQIQSGNKNDMENIEVVLKANGFPELLRQIVFDSTLFGDSFFEIKGKGVNIRLERLDPKAIEVKTGWHPGPRRAYHEIIDKIVEHVPEKREISRDDLLHFRSPEHLHDPLGFSVCGLWLTSWYIVKYAPQALINMAFRGVDIASMKRFAEMTESGIIAASGLPFFMVSPKIRLHPQFVALEKRRFQTHLKWRKEDIATTMERNFFPLILEKPFESKKFPEFIF